MPPTLARHLRKHTTHSTHASPPPTLARMASHFLNSFCCGPIQQFLQWSVKVKIKYSNPVRMKIPLGIQVALDDTVSLLPGLVGVLWLEILIEIWKIF